MLRGFAKRWRKPVGVAEIERQVEEEMRFHCEMLTEEYMLSGLTEEAALAAARRRFGDIERVQDECAQIKRRSRPIMRLLKLFLLLFFVSGFCLRMVVVELPFKQLADVMMATGVLGHVLLYLRGLRAVRSQSLKGSNVVLGLRAPESIEAYDAQGRTPLGRIMADKNYRDS